MISTLNGWSCSTRNARGLGRRQLAQLERVVGGDALAHPRLDGRQVVRGQRPRQLEVVVEAVVDDRPDAELRAGEQVEDRLGQDVRGRVAHRAELAGGAVIHAARRPTRARAPRGRSRPRRPRRPRPSTATLSCSSLMRVASSRITKPLVPRQDERFLPRSHPPSPPWWRTRGRANGRRPGRFAGRSRVVPLRRLDRRACSRDPALWGSAPRGASRSTLSSCCGGRHWTRTSDLLHVKQVL